MESALASVTDPKVAPLKVRRAAARRARQAARAGFPLTSAAPTWGNDGNLLFRQHPDQSYLWLDHSRGDDAQVACRSFSSIAADVASIDRFQQSRALGNCTTPGQRNECACDTTAARRLNSPRTQRNENTALLQDAMLDRDRSFSRREELGSLTDYPPSLPPSRARSRFVIKLARINSVLFLAYEKGNYGTTDSVRMSGFQR